MRQTRVGRSTLQFTSSLDKDTFYNAFRHALGSWLVMIKCSMCEHAHICLELNKDFLRNLKTHLPENAQNLFSWTDKTGGKVPNNMVLSASTWWWHDSQKYLFSDVSFSAQAYSDRAQERDRWLGRPENIKRQGQKFVECYKNPFRFLQNKFGESLDSIPFKLCIIN